MVKKTRRANRSTKRSSSTKKRASPKKTSVQSKRRSPTTTRRARVAARPQQPEHLGNYVGMIDHYYTHLGVGVLHVEGAALGLGDTIRIKGATTDFTQAVDSMQLDHGSIERAEKGQSVGLKVNQQVRQHDKVYRV